MPLQGLQDLRPPLAPQPPGGGAQEHKPGQEKGEGSELPPLRATQRVNEGALAQAHPLTSPHPNPWGSESALLSTLRALLPAHASLLCLDQTRRFLQTPTGSSPWHVCVHERVHACECTHGHNMRAPVLKYARTRVCMCTCVCTRTWECAHVLVGIQVFGESAAGNSIFLTPSLPGPRPWVLSSHGPCCPRGPGL